MGKIELKIGQIGKVTILEDTKLVKLEKNGSLSIVRPMKKGEEYRVYNFNSITVVYTVLEAEVLFKKMLKSKVSAVKAPAVQTGFKNCTELRKVYPGGVSVIKTVGDASNNGKQKVQT